MRVIGLMSGTSVDGIDAAAVDITGAPPHVTATLRAFTSVPFSEEQRDQIFALFDPQAATPELICGMNFQLGAWFADAAQQAMAQAGLTADDVDLIASHGQTLFHNVGPDAVTRSTMQIGEAAVIAARTGVTTVADFRVADVAVGGQGAPLVSYVDWLLLRHPVKTRAVQNIGGIANVTYLPADSDGHDVLAFDTGPGNMIIDAVAAWHSNGAQRYDVDGRLAAAGRVDEDLLAELLRHPYFALPAPKTTGREQFGAQYARELIATAQARGLSGADLAATVTAFTAWSIADAYRTLPALPDEIILGGGGAHNPTLRAVLGQALPGIRVLTHADVGMDDDAKEALAFAVLGYECWHGRPGNLPSCTQASRALPLGKITPGENFGRLIKRVGA